jgi:hypothetical protein
MKNGRTIRLIDENLVHGEVFREALRAASGGPFLGEWVKTFPEGCDRLKKKEIWAIFFSLCLQGSKGLLTFDQLLREAPGVPTLVLGGVEHGWSPKTN